MMAMMTRTKSEVRSIVTDDEFGGFQITISPSAKAWLTSGIALTMWVLVMGLTLQGVVAKHSRNNAEDVKFFVIWLMFGLAFAFVACGNWLRRDTVIIEGKALILRKEFSVFRWERMFELSEVRNLRPAPPDNSNGVRAEQRGRPSAVAFDFQNRTFQFGVRLSESEVMRLIKTIRERFPIRDDWREAEPLPVSR
jgi:hypothetical protein